jgi:hypothetical protein
VAFRRKKETSTTRQAGGERAVWREGAIWKETGWDRYRKERSGGGV